MRAEGYGRVVRSLSFPAALLVLLPLLPGVLALGACGRSAEPLLACPQPAAECKDLIAQQSTVEAVFAGADDADVDLRDEAAQCTQLLVEVSLDQQCVEGCAELCRLHPCAVVDDAGGRFDPSTCKQRCEDLQDAGDIVDADLDAVVVKAAEAPGFCTCRACTAADDVFCTRLFDCAIAP